ncbi:hypothetical protein ACHAXR_003341 [Thalassiosira sp. AJA248-18]
MNIPSLFPFFHTKCDSSAPPPLPPLSAPGNSSTDTATKKLSTPEKTTDTTSAPPPPPPATTSTASASSAAPPPPAADDDIAKAAASVSSCPNPGPLEAATWDVRRLVTLDTYDGVRVDISKQLSPYFAVVHSFHLGTTMLPDGKNASYGFTTQMNDEEGFMMARVDPERGSVDGRIHKALLGGLAMAKLQVGVSSEGANDQLLGEIDVGAATWTANLKYGSMGGGNVFGCNYYQAISPRLSMGGEGMYIGANGNQMSSYTAKYLFPNVNNGDGDDKDGSAAAAAPGAPPGEAPSYLAATYNAGQGMLSLNYKRAVTPSRVNIGASLECSPMTLESQVLVGAEFNLTRSKMNVCVDGTGRIQSVLEAKLGREPGSPALNFAAELDHGKNVMKFGYGLNIGS